MLQRCLEHYLLSTTNQPFCVIVNYTIKLIGGYSPKGALAIKKNVLEFLGILGSFWRILDISKRILDHFSGKFPKNFRPHFGNYVAKPILVSFFPFLCLSATYAPGLRSPPKIELKNSLQLKSYQALRKTIALKFPKVSIISHLAFSLICPHSAGSLEGN